MVPREILKILHQDGWREMEARTKGSHIQLKHPTKPGKVTVPNHRRLGSRYIAEYSQTGRPPIGKERVPCAN